MVEKRFMASNSCLTNVYFSLSMCLLHVRFSIGAIHQQGCERIRKTWATRRVYYVHSHCVCAHYTTHEKRTFFGMPEKPHVISFM